MSILGVLGVGELTEKIMLGLSSHQSGLEAVLSPRNREKAQGLSETLACEVMPDNQSVVDAADILLIGVRPAQQAALAEELTLKPRQKLISLVTGVSIRELCRLFGDAQCIRAMLSVAAEVNCSTVAIYPADAEATTLLSPLGNLVALSTEYEFELATVAACMNGWFYFLLHDMQQWLGAKGMAPDQARALVLSSVEGCVGYARHQGATPIGDLGRSIAQPGTFTARGLDELDSRQANAAWKAACETVLGALVTQSGTEAGQRSAASEVSMRAGS